MREYKVTNLTQGRLEVRELKKVLDAGAWTTVAEPLPETLVLMRGGRKVSVEEILKPPAPTKRLPLSAQAAAPQETEPPRRGKPKE